MQSGTDKAQAGASARSEPALPQVFGRYLLVQRLSRGGMGEIFLAKHGLAGFEKLAVIKKVLPHLAADNQFISRFVDEAQVAIKLQHVNVAQVFEVGRVGDEYFLALEYIDGRDLRRTLALLGHRNTRMPVDLALFIGRELANGLAYAHRRASPDGASLNLVHCDISPPNVLVSFEGETKVIDFGIAKSALRGTATDPKMGFGKYGYMAPEQLIRGGTVDHRTDIYAAGVVLFELLAGQRLYEGGPDPDYRDLARKVSKGEYKLPSQVDLSLLAYDDLVATALRPNPDERYQSAAEFRDAIQQCLVAVNPTISTDQLGAYMRELFADEMTGQRELHERVASAHLSDFKEQFHTQTISTVSFALAQLPSGAFEPVAAVAPASSVDHTTTPVGRSPSLPRVTGPVSAAGAAITGDAPVATPAAGPDDDSLLAAGTGAVARERLRGDQRRLRLWAIAAAAGLGVVVAVALVTMLNRSRDPESPPVAAARVLPPQPQITVEPITEPAAAAGSAMPAAAATVEPSAVPAEPAPAASVAKQHHAATSSHRPEPPRPARAELTRDAVKIQFQATSRLYEAYRAKNGARLEQDWNNLATFMQYKLSGDNLEDAMHRIDEFRGKLRD